LSKCPTMRKPRPLSRRPTGPISWGVACALTSRVAATVAVTVAVAGTVVAIVRGATGSAAQPAIGY